MVAIAQVEITFLVVFEYCAQLCSIWTLEREVTPHRTFPSPVTWRYTSMSPNKPGVWHTLRTAQKCLCVFSWINRNELGESSFSFVCDMLRQSHHIKETNQWSALLQCKWPEWSGIRIRADRTAGKRTRNGERELLCEHGPSRLERWKMSLSRVHRGIK